MIHTHLNDLPSIGLGGIATRELSESPRARIMVSRNSCVSCLQAIICICINDYYSKHYTRALTYMLLNTDISFIESSERSEDEYRVETPRKRIPMSWFRG